PVAAALHGKLFWEPAGYGEAEWRPTPRWLLVPGLRLDHFSLGHENVAQPRLSARFQVAATVTLKGGVGLYAQDPSFDESDPTFGNGDLRAERALHTSGGAEWRPLAGVVVDATIFHKQLWSLVGPTDTVVV